MTVGSALVSWPLSLSSVSPHIPDHFISLAAYFWWYFHPSSPVEHSLKLLYVAKSLMRQCQPGAGLWEVEKVMFGLFLTSYYNFNILKGLWYVCVVW